MKKHLLCLTVDTDPDGLSGRTTDRRALSWKGLECLQSFPEAISKFTRFDHIPVTWFVRADGQLESMLGDVAYLLETYAAFWGNLGRAGDEIGWHPHLYRQRNVAEEAVLISDPQEAADELQRLWNNLKVRFQPTAFRNGEGWHTPETYSLVEQLGFRCDSTAIPGRRGNNGHPMNWEVAPNHPYFPSISNLCLCGPDRPLLELPMNTWLLQAPHDFGPRTRYMNPAVHPHLFANSLRNWENACKISHSDLSVWVMIFHPDEVLGSRGPDGLYSRSQRDLCSNLRAVAEALQRLGQAFEWVTISAAAKRWRTRQQHLTQ